MRPAPSAIPSAARAATARDAGGGDIATGCRPRAPQSVSRARGSRPPRTRLSPPPSPRTSGTSERTVTPRRSPSTTSTTCKRDDQDHRDLLDAPLHVERKGQAGGRCDQRAQRAERSRANGSAEQLVNGHRGESYNDRQIRLEDPGDVLSDQRPERAYRDVSAHGIRRSDVAAQERVDRGVLGGRARWPESARAPPICAARERWIAGSPSTKNPRNVALPDERRPGRRTGRTSRRRRPETIRSRTGSAAVAQAVASPGERQDDDQRGRPRRRGRPVGREGRGDDDESEANRHDERSGNPPPGHRVDQQAAAGANGDHDQREQQPGDDQRLRARLRGRGAGHQLQVGGDEVETRDGAQQPIAFQMRRADRVAHSAVRLSGSMFMRRNSSTSKPWRRSSPMAERRS